MYGIGGPISGIPSTWDLIDQIGQHRYSGVVRFEWDDAKDEINQKKHGVAFEVASRVFADPNVLE